MKDILMFRIFLMKCEPVVTNNKSYIEKTFNYASFPNPRVNCMEIKDSFGVSWLPIYICD